ncbi:DUF4012 domain-containing protein [Agromyces sp. LHK192]|uniref:DUF4012 domain-containing protein n=1 Tax=Agromyces sp. LHK192 TaxID=2498704 RepID=UPI000FDA23DF|nr:DUF4012 domain-containing protein [Agromyces sp. LHK192]
MPLARQAQQQILAGDVAKATVTANEFAGHAASAAQLTGDPVYWLYERLPLLGPNLEVLRSVSASVDTVARGAVVPLAQAAGSVDVNRFAPAGGRIDLQAMIDLQQPVGSAASAFDIAAAMVLRPAVASADVVGPLADARDEYSTLVADARDTVDALDRAVTLLPSMLGAEGPRDILLLFQNNAELRTLGGVSSALALVHADGGAVAMTQQADSGDIGRFPEPVVALPIETRALWGDNTARYIQDVNFTPQFPLAATIAREMWRQRYAVEPQSVVAVDPVMLSYLLAATGPITLANGTQLSTENAVQYLLSDVYLQYSGNEADAVFQDAAASVFAALTSGSIDARAMVEALAKAGAERRILVWNADVEEQAVLAGTDLSGELPASTPDDQVFGVYLNDMTGSKMDTYLDVQYGVGATTCRNDRLPLYEIHVTLTNTAPADAATSLPPYVTGDGNHGTPPGQIATSVHVYGEQGTYNLGVLLDDQPVGYHPTSDTGYTLSKVVSRLDPGESATYRFAFLGGEPIQKAPVIESTPLVDVPEILGVALSCESALW